ncbi:hypothetical protein [Legionella septentrionalis]|uniref:hypothetical protein n=1 Tax=Legionella septentrionalis TaxID=2498109 RepID=UPI000F8D594D|nr:hypothetical protein [Legionella septentrionalis]RUR09191.1 hypothetical protein ELY14_09380 [Legionella septentrionalis]
MKRFYRILLLCSLLVPGHLAVAAEQFIKPSLILNHIELIRAQEAGGDELYFDISIYRPNKTTQFVRIPKAPMHWPSAASKQIKNVTLWSEPLKEGESVVLIASLIEQDATPLNPDDVLGSIRVKLTYEQGQLKTQWSIPNREQGPAMANQQGDIQKFELFDAGSKYDVYLSLAK